MREAELDVGRTALDAKRQENFGSSALRGYAGLGHLSLPWSVRGNEPALGVFKHAGGVLFRCGTSQHPRAARVSYRPPVLLYLGIGLVL